MNFCHERYLRDSAACRISSALRMRKRELVKNPDDDKYAPCSRRPCQIPPTAKTRNYRENYSGKIVAVRIAVGKIYTKRFFRTRAK